MIFSRNNFIKLSAAYVVMISIASAADAPLIFSHGTITIERHSQPATPKEENKEMVATNVQQSALPPLSIDVIIREAASFYNQEGWFNLDSLKEGRGILLVFDNPVSAPIIGVNQYAPLDIYMIDSEGMISEIAPSLVLAKLEDHIYPKTPIKAFLLLAGGSHERHSINPGDEVHYPIFKKPPPILDTTTPDQPTLQPLTEPAPTAIAPQPIQPEQEQPVAPATPPADPNNLSIKRVPVGQSSVTPKESVILP